MPTKTSRKGKAGVKGRAIVITTIAFVVLLIPAATLALFSYSQARDVDVRVTADREAMVGLAGTALSAKLTKIAGVISTVASSQELSSDVAAGNFGDGIALIQSLENNPALSDPYIERTVLIDLNGAEMASYPKPSWDTTTIAMTWDVAAWQKAFADGVPFSVSGVTDVDESSSLETDIVIASPIVSPSTNKIVGFGAVEIPADNFLKFDGDISVGGSGYVYLVDQNSNIVADPATPADEADIISDASDAGADLALAGKSGVMIESDAVDDETNFVAYAPVPDYHWGVIIIEPYQEVFAASASIISTMEFSLILFAGMAIVALILLFIFLTGRQKNHAK